MKKLIKVCLIMIATMITVGFVSTIPTQAKVTYKLSKGTLTVKGKGKMPKKMVFKNNKKIKKVVIKKGVTSISKNAFYGCKNVKSIKIAKTVKTLGRNCFRKTGISSITVPSSVKTIYNGVFFECNKLEKITMPGKFKLAGKPDSDENSNIFTTYTSKNILDTIKFNSNIDLNSLQYLKANNFIAYKKDKKYKSIDGVLYSKDGKEIVRVPCKRKELVIANGCETFCLSSIFYGYKDWEEGTLPRCLNLSSITIPASVKTIEDKKYRSKYFSEEYVPLEIIKIEGKNIDSESAYTLIKHIKKDYDASISADMLMKLFPQYIKKENGCYIMGKRLIAADADQEIVTVPNTVQVITPKIFYQTESVLYDSSRKIFKVKKIILPDGVKVIESYAFERYNNEIEEINIPNTVERLEDFAFSFTAIKKITIPDNVKYIGKSVFHSSNLTEVTLPKNITTIPEGMFEYSNLKTVYNIDKIQKIEKSAFKSTNVDIQKILDVPSLRHIGSRAFAYTKANKLVIPSHIKKIDKNVFESSDPKEIIIKGSSKEFADNCFVEYANEQPLTLTYEKGIKESKTDIYNDDTWYLHKDNTFHAKVSWAKVQNVSGYKIQVASDKKFKKVIKKITASKKEKSKNIKIKTRNKKVYIRIRPFKVINGKNVYGRWTEAGRYTF